MSPRDIREYLATLDADHRAYAQGYADELSLGDPAPSNAGLNRQIVREIRRRVWAEWRRRMSMMPGQRRPAGR
jgi:hypothetical protein